VRGRILSLCVAVSILAGCGSSKAVSTAPAASTTAAPAATNGAATTTKSATAGSTPTTTTAASAAPKLTGAADNDFCRYLVDLGKKASLDNSDIPLGESPEQLKQATIETQTLYNDMAKRAPAEIKAEMAQVAGSFNRLAAIYASVDYDTAKLQQQMSDPTSAIAVEFSKMGTESLAGGEKVDTYIQDVCGLKG
jgi:hypothetical protein